MSPLKINFELNFAGIFGISSTHNAKCFIKILEFSGSLLIGGFETYRMRFSFVLTEATELAKVSANTGYWLVRLALETWNAESLHEILVM